MNHFDFFKHDLNLLVAFDALYTEKSVSAAAQRVGVSQSAMSQSLRRLRTTFGDELFIRTSRGVEPTQAAVALSTPLNDALLQIHRLLVEKTGFVPQAADRVFSLAMSDVQQLLLLPGLLERIAQEAPGVTLRTLPFERSRVDRQLDDGELDLAISRFEDPDVRHPTQLLFEETHMCLYDPRRVKVPERLTLEAYLRYPHLLIAHGGGLTGALDEQIPATKGKRRIMFTTPYAHAIPYILERVAAFAVVPHRLALHCAKAGTLKMQPPPVKWPSYRISMKWHARNSGDAGLQWLRSLLVDTASREAPADAGSGARGRRRRR